MAKCSDALKADTAEAALLSPALCEEPPPAARRLPATRGAAALLLSTFGSGGGMDNVVLPAVKALSLTRVCKTALPAL